MTELKILFDGYLIKRYIFAKQVLIINDFLFDGYLIAPELLLKQNTERWK